MLLDIYHRLPYWAKVVAASGHGYYLNWLRYGSNVEEAVSEVLRREGYSHAELMRLQSSALAQTLAHAARSVPHYRDLWQARRRSGDTASPEELANWPVLEKETVRENPRRFLADDRPFWMFQSHTSGTTGTPLRLFESRTAVQTWYALSEARWRRWYGVAQGDPYAIAGGRLVASVGRQKPPFWVWNKAFSQLYLSSYHLSPQAVPHYLDALRSHGVVYLLGYTSALVALAEGALREGRDDLQMKVVITNAEPLYPFQRAILERAFQCPVRETYGLSEMVGAASECEHGNLHLWPLCGYMEVMHKDQPVPPGSTGDLVCTGLINADMPLIRYRTGDCGALSTEQTCPCGRSLPRLQHVEGRADDVLYTADGRKVGRLDPVLKGDLPVREVQIVQQRLDELRVRYVPGVGFEGSALRKIEKQLRLRMGNIQVHFEALDSIPRGPNGKFRAVLCELDSSLKTELERIPAAPHR